MGNRTRLEKTTSTKNEVTRSTPNALNQLTAISTSQNGGASLTSGLSYDVGGNLTQTMGSDGAKTLYLYDAADRLTRIERKNAAGAFTGKSEFVYDYASRKVVSREFTYLPNAPAGTDPWNKTNETRRVFDGLDVIQERNAANEVSAQYVRDGNIGGILSRTSASGKSYFHYDGGGNVTALSDENGNLVGRYSYDAFGNTLESSGARAAENPYRFSTKEHIAGLVDFGYRFYSPGMGRWINRDPIGENGGINLYAMVGNKLVNTVDEYGLIDLESVGASIKNALGKSVTDPKGALEELNTLRAVMKNAGNGRAVSRLDRAINKVTRIMNSGYKHQFSPRYWKEVRQLPRDIRNALEKQVRTLERDPNHPSLNLERLGGFANRWSCRINDQYRIIGERVEGGFVWRQISPHDYRIGTIYR